MAFALPDVRSYSSDKDAQLYFTSRTCTFTPPPLSFSSPYNRRARIFAHSQDTVSHMTECYGRTLIARCVHTAAGRRLNVHPGYYIYNLLEKKLINKVGKKNHHICKGNKWKSGCIWRISNLLRFFFVYAWRGETVITFVVVTFFSDEKKLPTWGRESKKKRDRECIRYIHRVRFLCVRWQFWFRTEEA